MHYLDSYPIQSRLRKVHPQVKMFFYILHTSFALVSHSMWIFVFIIPSMLFYITLTAKIKILRLARLMFIPASFILLSSLSVILERNPAEPMLIGFNWGNSSFGITEIGITEGGLLLLRSISLLSILYAFILNTSISDIIYVMKRIKVPTILLEIMVLVYRNIFIFSDSAKCIYTSQTSRLGFRNYKTTLTSLSKLCGRVFVLAEVRADHLYKSMESRCYNGTINTLPGEWNTNRNYWIISLTYSLLLLIGIFIYK